LNGFHNAKTIVNNIKKFNMGMIQNVNLELVDLAFDVIKHTIRRLRI